MATDDIAEALRKKYCPPLDEALFYALLADFDINQDHSRQELEVSLQSLKDSAAIEQELELLQDPDQRVDDKVSSQPLSTNASDLESTSHPAKVGETPTADAATSLTSQLSQLEVSAQPNDNDSLDDVLALDLGDEGEDLQNATQEVKIKWLQHMFPSVNRSQIQETLVRCQDEVHRSMDELLNLVFITEEDLHDGTYRPPSVVKGVDGFAMDGNDRRKRKLKGKKKKLQSNVMSETLDTSDSALSSGSVTPITNVWQSASQDVDFIKCRTGMSESLIKSLYRDNGAQLPKTIRYMVNAEGEAYSRALAEEADISLQMEELRFIFADVPEQQLYGALVLAHNIPSAAEELLGAMLVPDPVSNMPENLKLVPQYAPLNLSEEDTEPKSRLESSQTLAQPTDHRVLLDQADVHSTAAHRAVGQATAAFRRGKSNHLYGGAAAYYASEYHDQRKREKALLSSAADSLVAQQSGTSYIDLHGINVEHAKRITRDKLERWWEGLGDRKLIHSGIGEGFKIITGVGTHSSQGRARLGPAISTMLINEGWKINIQRGEIFVEGKKSR